MLRIVYLIILVLLSISTSLSVFAQNNSFLQLQGKRDKGVDIQIEKREDGYYITAVQPGSSAEQCGLHPGMKLLTINNYEVTKAVKKLLPQPITFVSSAMYKYAADTMLASFKGIYRIIEVEDNGVRKLFFPDGEVTPNIEGKLPINDGFHLLGRKEINFLNAFQLFAVSSKPKKNNIMFSEF